MNWISVKDRLPEDGDGVFVYGNLKDMGHFHAVMVYYEGEFIDTDTDITNKKVTHWAELTSPDEKQILPLDVSDYIAKSAAYIHWMVLGQRKDVRDKLKVMSDKLLKRYD